MGFTRSHSTRERIAGQIMRTFILLFFFCSCQGRPQIGNTDPQQQQSIVSLQSGQEQFTNRLLQQIESNTTTNFVLSPHSIHSVFSQLLQGSGGQTKAELENLLGVTASDSLVEQYRILGQGLSGEGFKQANLLAVANSFKPKREYRTSLNNGFQSDIREFDFGSNSLGSVEEINRYVEEVTNEKIKDLLADDDVDGLTRMVLINAVYFKANWQFAFNAEETFESSFNSPEGGVSTQYMSREADVRMLVDNERQLQILELPYEDSNRSMLIVLPNAGTSTNDLVQRLDGLDLASIRSNGRLATTSIFIPKFKLKFKTYLKQQMEQLGVRNLFTRTADLSGISNSLDNSVICNKVASEGKKLDWLRKNRALCEESKDFFDNFMSKSCGALRCDFAAPQLADWSTEANSSGVGGCQGVEGRVESVQTKRRCKTVKNKLKAAEFLQCRN